MTLGTHTNTHGSRVSIQEIKRSLAQIILLLVDKAPCPQISHFPFHHILHPTRASGLYLDVSYPYHMTSRVIPVERCDRCTFTILLLLTGYKPYPQKPSAALIRPTHPPTEYTKSRCRHTPRSLPDRRQGPAPCPGSRNLWDKTCRWIHRRGSSVPRRTPFWMLHRRVGPGSKTRPRTWSR